MMKRTIIITTFIYISLSSLFAQNNCEEYPGNIDSTYTLFWNAENMSWDLNTIRHYKYATNNIVNYINFNPNTRDTISEWQYYYDSSGIKTHDLYYSWANNTRSLIQKKEFEYNAEFQKTREFISNLVNGVWTWRANQLFEYEGNKLISTIYQLKDKNGVIYNFTNTIYNYYNGQLVEVITKRGSDNFVTKISRYTWYNNQVSEIVYFEPFKNPNTNLFEYIHTTKRIYTYDIYSFMKEVKSQLWINGEWLDYAKEVYFRKIDVARKVYVCHKGKSLCVAKNALPAFLNQGATLGKCTIDKEQQSASIVLNSKKDGKFELNIFPNPVSNHFSISGLKPSVKRVDIYNAQGSLVLSIENSQNETLRIEREGLPSGIYFVNIIAEDEIQTKQIVFN